MLSFRTLLYGRALCSVIVSRERREIIMISDFKIVFQFTCIFLCTLRLRDISVDLNYNYYCFHWTSGLVTHIFMERVYEKISNTYYLTMSQNRKPTTLTKHNYVPHNSINCFRTTTVWVDYWNTNIIIRYNYVRYYRCHLCNLLWYTYLSLNLKIL